jgi:hypothetical protein
VVRKGCLGLGVSLHVQPGFETVTNISSRDLLVITMLKHPSSASTNAGI